MRLNAFLAQAGVSSRRGADELIKTGRVSVNGRTGELNDKIGNNDVVKIDDKQIELRKSRYILLYKPAGFMTTMKDPQARPKVVDLIDIPERVVPVGRLDYDTTGALLLTNDGDLANRLMHPSFKIDKLYEAEVDRSITTAALNKLEQGVEIDTGITSPAKATQLAGNKIELVIHEGRKNQVKKMLAAVGLPVKSLHRAKYAGLDLKGLEPGRWRYLTDAEIKKLKS